MLQFNLEKIKIEKDLENELYFNNMKNSVFTTSLVLVTASILMLTPATTNIVGAQIENDVSSNNISDMTENNFPMNIGELILETQTQSEGMKIIDIDKQKVEGSWSGNGTLQKNIPVMDFGTYFSTLKDEGYAYSNGYGMIISFDNEVAKYTFQSIGKMDAGKFNNWGSIIFDTTTNPNGTLSVLENTIGVYTGEVDINGNTITKIWKLDK